MAIRMRNTAKKVLLVILDGWGVAPPWGGNAISLAELPFYRRLIRQCPNSLLAASGKDVGLPGNEVGNSEVGHLNLGAGRIVGQDVVKINSAIEDGSFFKNPVLIEAIKRTLSNHSNLHIMGILSDAPTHGHINHLYALLVLCKRLGQKQVYIHLFTDGRDTEPSSAQSYLSRVLRVIQKLGVGQIATISGRYYAMDRDNRWERTGLVYNALVLGQAATSMTPLGAVAQAYRRGETDEFIRPTVILQKQKPPPTIKDGDSIIFYNFRSDRAKQLTRILLGQKVPQYQRPMVLKDIFFVSFIPYGLEKELGIENIKSVFPPIKLKAVLGELISQQMKQFRLAETEKSAHITYFFNGMREEPFPGEERLFIPSPKVATYDQKPEMSAPQVDSELKKALRRDYGFILVNFANPDMVGHTGNIRAVREAVEFLDKTMADFVPQAQVAGFWTIISADHGNAEQMINPLSGFPDPEHTNNPVPFILISPIKDSRIKVLPGRLSDVAPTILHLVGIQQPPEMTGRNLISYAI